MVDSSKSHEDEDLDTDGLEVEAEAEVEAPKVVEPEVKRKLPNGSRPKTSTRKAVRAN
jgi:hypothetical protein